MKIYGFLDDNYTDIFKLQEFLEQSTIPFEFTYKYTPDYTCYLLQYPRRTDCIVSVICGINSNLDWDVESVMDLICESDIDSISIGLSPETVFNHIQNHCDGNL